MLRCNKMSSRKRPSDLKDSPKTKKARTEEAGTSKSAEVCLIITCIAAYLSVDIDVSFLVY